MFKIFTVSCVLPFKSAWCCLLKMHSDKGYELFTLRKYHTSVCVLCCYYSYVFFFHASLG